MRQQDPKMKKISSEEIVQIVDRENNEVNATSRAEMRRLGLPHRASYILVFNSQNQLFIQKRTLTKDVFPGYWDIAAGGVVLANESYIESATRELQEELGITDVPLEFLFHHYFEDDTIKVWGGVYRCYHDGPFLLQEEEIEYGRFINIDDVLNSTLEEPFCPDGVDILKRLFDHV